MSDEEKDKPNPHDPELVNHPEVFNYIAVRNWGTFQKVFKTKTRPYIMDACCKDSDSDYCQLTLVQRQILDGTRRQIGLHGQNIANSSEVLGRSLAVRGQERHNVLAAMRQLTKRGFYILSNEASPFTKEVNKEVSNYVSPSATADAGSEAINTNSKTKRRGKASYVIPAQGCRCSVPGCMDHCMDPALRQNIPGLNQYGGTCSCVKHYEGKKEITEVEWGRLNRIESGIGDENGDLPPLH